MLKEKPYPILEYDSDRRAKLQPANIINKTKAPKACVITFFKEVIKKKLELGELEQIGHLVLPCSAVRDEGVSYHYIEPSREIECNPEAIAAIERVLKREKIPYIKAKTWTTDAIFRETEAKIAKRVSEGCVTVEMEAAAFFAVSKFRNVLLGQILYGGDDLSGIEWNSRSWVSRDMIRANLVDLSLRIATEL